MVHYLVNIQLNWILCKQWHIRENCFHENYVKYFKDSTKSSHYEKLLLTVDKYCKRLKKKKKTIKKSFRYLCRIESERKWLINLLEHPLSASVTNSLIVSKSKVYVKVSQSELSYILWASYMYTRYSLGKKRLAPSLVIVTLSWLLNLFKQRCC